MHLRHSLRKLELVLHDFGALRPYQDEYCLEQIDVSYSLYLKD